MISLRCKILCLILILLHINIYLAEGKRRGGSKSGNSGGIKSQNRGRSLSRSVVAAHLGLSWWMYKKHYPNDRYNDDNAGSFDDDDDPDEGATTDLLLVLSGVGFVVIWLATYCLRATFKYGQYNQSEYSMIQFLTFMSYLAVMIIMYNVPTDDQGYNMEAWNNWFDNSTSFVEIGHNPINWFDVYFCGIGFALSMIILMKDFCNDSSRKEPMELNLLTQVVVILFGIIFVSSLVLGFHYSWKIPLILLSMCTLLSAIARFVGLTQSNIFSRSGQYLQGNVNGNNDGIVPASTLKCIIHDVLDFLGGVASVAFHVRLAVICEEWAIFMVNFVSFGMGLLPVLFNPIFIYFTWENRETQANL